MYIGEKGQVVEIFSGHNKAPERVKGEGETIRMVLIMLLGTDYGRCKLPISRDSRGNIGLS